MLGACSLAEGHESLASTTPAITSTTGPTPIAISTPGLLILDIPELSFRLPSRSLVHSTA
jgi:hypothetical protein